MPESISMTRALLSLKIAQTYFDDVAIDFPGLSRKIKEYSNKISFIENDALCVLTDSGRQAYRREVKKGDYLAFENLFQLFGSMSLDQRKMLETMAEALLKGQLEITQ